MRIGGDESVCGPLGGGLDELCCGMLGNVILMSDAALSGIDIGPTGGLLAVELWPMKTV